MDNGIINSIVARCLLDHNFMEQILQNPEVALCDYRLTEALRSEFRDSGVGIRNFSAFVTMVQHNYLWTFYPYTRALLKFYGIEIEAFGRYHERYLQLRNSGATRDQKMGAFLDFLQSYLSDTREMIHKGLYDVLIHERTMSEIRAELNQDQSSNLQPTIIDVTTLKPIEFRKIIPNISGVLRTARFSYDPLQIIAQLAQGNFKPDELTFGPRFLVYWVNTVNKQLRVFEIDNFTGLLLSEVNGYRSIRNISNRVRRNLSSPIATSEFREFFEKLFQEGIFVARIL